MWHMQQQKGEWQDDPNRGPSIAKVTAVLVLIGAVIAALIAIF